MDRQVLVRNAFPQVVTIYTVSSPRSLEAQRTRPCRHSEGRHSPQKKKISHHHLGIIWASRPVTCDGVGLRVEDTIFSLPRRTAIEL